MWAKQMASSGTAALLGAGWLFGIAMTTSLLWYLFWVVMAPVELDIESLVNWYFFMKLGLSNELDFYSVLKEVHNWLPLLVITALVLSKAAMVYRDFLVTISQLVYVTAIAYNLFLVVFMFYAGQKVLQLFAVTLPLYTLLHAGPLLSHLFSPSTVWLPTSCLLLLYFLLCRRYPLSEKRQKGCGLWDLTVVAAAKRVTIIFLVPVVLAALTYLVMEKGCLPCSSTPSFQAKSSPPKPSLIGHRGCSSDFPENSLAAYKAAVLLPAVAGLETDLTVSMDGVPFLMHDPHLVRTTDVRSKCPSHDPFSNASLLYFHNGTCPLKKIGIARGFLRSKGGKISPQDRALYESQHIPTFREFLSIAERSGKVIIFDIIRPPVGHPYHHSYLNKTLQDIAASRLLHNKVWWLPPDRRKWVYQHYPGFVQTTKTEVTPFEQLQEEHIQKMNEDWGISLEQFRRYQDANLSISMFFVESAFMYSYAWCVGVGSVTTGNCKFLSKVDTNPFLTICRQWDDYLTSSPTLIIVGMLAVLLQVLFLISWETLRLWQAPVKR